MPRVWDTGTTCGLSGMHFTVGVSGFQGKLVGARTRPPTVIMELHTWLTLDHDNMFRSWFLGWGPVCNIQQHLLVKGHRWDYLCEPSSSSCCFSSFCTIAACELSSSWLLMFILFFNWWNEASLALSTLWVCFWILHVVLSEEVQNYVVVQHQLNLMLKLLQKSSVPCVWRSGALCLGGVEC